MSERLFEADARLASCEARVVAADERGVRLDRTVFYARGGGQPGDCGTLRAAEGAETAVADTVKDEKGDVVHILADGAPPPPVGATVTAEIDWPRRHRLMRMHSCLHLLSALVPGAVTGGQVGVDKSRLDFDLAGAEKPDKAALTDALNALIAEDRPVSFRLVAEAELDASPELVKTLSVAPPRGAGRVRLVEVEGVDLQACGGTHVARTGEIGRVRVSKIENKGRRNRRVTVVFDE